MKSENYDTVAATLAAAIIAKTPTSSAPTPRQAVELFNAVRKELDTANGGGKPVTQTVQLP